MKKIFCNIEKYLQGFLEERRRTNWIRFVLFTAFIITSIKLLSTHTDIINLLKHVQNVTFGLVRSDLVANSVLIYITIVGVRLSGLRLIDIGITKQKLKQGILLSVYIFVLVNIACMLINLFSTGDLHLTISSMQNRWTNMAGSVVSFIAGVAPFEEILWRGFFLIQIALFLFRILGSAFVSCALSMLIVSVAFAYGHSHGAGFAELGIERTIYLITVSLAFCILYLRFDNIFLVAGIHAIFNISAFMSSNGFGYMASRTSQIVTLIIAFLLALYWHAYSNKVGNKQCNVSDKSSEVTYNT